MSSESSARRPGIFLSHSHQDKPFVRHLAHDLTSAGAKVWVDEAEMDIGDSLLDKITSAIADMDYLAVVISAYSAHSEWVTREIEVAMQEEIEGKRIKVIPLLLRGGVLPSVLAGKLFADFTSEIAYSGSLHRLLTRLGIESPSPSAVADRLSELASFSGLLAAALEELREDGLTEATMEALVSSKVADIELSEFLSLAVEETSDSQKLFGLAIALIRYIDARGVGQRALDTCLRSGRLETWQIEYVGMRMQYVKSSAAIQWCHSRMVSVIRSDVYYNSFLNKHLEVVVEQCYDEMAAYLLRPDRGPGNYNLDSFELVISRTENPLPFQRRMIEWINDHFFDLEGEEMMGWESPGILYQMLNDHWGESKFDVIVQTINEHVYLIMKTRPRDPIKHGMYHLVAMIYDKYHGADFPLNEILPRVYDVPYEEKRILKLITEGLQAVVEYAMHPSNRDLKKAADKWFYKIADADKNGITGYFGN